MFYHYRQNNSGGVFVINDRLTVNVIIEATDAAEADSKLEDMGGYFQGCSMGRDCSCCGDRWHSQDGFGKEVSKRPMIYGDFPSKYVEKEKYLWAPKGKNVVIYYANGKVKWY